MGDRSGESPWCGVVLLVGAALAVGCATGAAPSSEVQPTPAASPSMVPDTEPAPAPKTALAVDLTVSTVEDGTEPYTATKTFRLRDGQLFYRLQFSGDPRHLEAVVDDLHPPAMSIPVGRDRLDVSTTVALDGDGIEALTRALQDAGLLGSAAADSTVEQPPVRSATVYALQADLGGVHTEVAAQPSAATGTGSVEALHGFGRRLAAELDAVLRRRSGPAVPIP